MEKPTSTTTTDAKPFHIPLDVCADILSKLPDKSLSRLKSVSKAWCNLCSTITPVAEACPGLLSLRHNPDETTTITIFSNLDDGQETGLLSANKISFPVPGRVDFLHSCNGLLLLQAPKTAKSPNPIQLFVCNPFRQQLVALPSPPDINAKVGRKEADTVLVAGLAFDGEDKHYKVVLLYMVPSGRRTLAVYDSRSRGWAASPVSKLKLAATGGHPVKTELHHRLATLYWRGTLYWVFKKEFMLVLHIKSKEAELVRLPVDGSKHIEYFWTCRGRVLGILSPAVKKQEVSYTVWALEGDGGRGWEFWRRINVRPRRKSQGSPVGYCDERGILYVKLESTGEIVGYDFEGKIMRMDVGRLKHSLDMKEVQPFKMFEVKWSIAS